MMPHESRSSASRRLALRLGAEDAEAPLTAGAPAVRFRTLLAAARRHLWTIVLWGLLLPLLAAAIFIAWPKRYDASTRLLVDPRGLQIVDRDVTPRSDSTDQAVTVVESEMRFVTSDTVFMAVIEKHNLTADPEFNGSERYFWSPLLDVIDIARTTLRTALGVDSPEGPADLAALSALSSKVKIEREPQSFVIDVAVRTNSAEKSARIANAIAQQYLDTRFAARSSATERASAAIVGRLDELRKAVEEADDKVESYKRSQGIIGADGKLVNEQQLGEVNTQLGNARDEVGRAAARVEQIRALRASSASADAISEVVSSPTITQLRSQQASIQQRYAAVTADMLPSHPEVKQVRQRLDAANRLIKEEIDRISQTAQLDLKRAKDTEKAIEKRLTDLKQLAQTTNEKIVHLRELEREAEARRAVYTNLLLRSRELDEQKRVDPSLVIVLSPAVPPQRPGGPPITWILAAATFLGLGLGVGHALTKDYRDRSLRSAMQSQDLFGVESTSMPDLGTSTGSRRGRIRRRQPAGDVGPMPRFAIDNPDMPATRALKGLASEILTSTGKTSSLILVTSVDEGPVKSTIALNLALAAAELGERVLLVDGDCETPAISTEIGAGAKPGLENLADQRKAATAHAISPPDLTIDVLPNGTRQPRLHTGRNAQLENALAAITGTYDTVVIDGGVLPHGRLLPMFVGMAHEVILVTTCGTTQKASLADAVKLLEAAGVERMRTLLVEA
ncbi:MAG: exopolysaccharide transport family protein [Alphaproteobacteria bacterium]|nr:exopolysaccharide transport family protein [Alphaproteobacteria bacterium]